MTKRKGLTHEQKIIAALEKLPNPLEDEKHRIFIYFVNDQARSNQTRFEHISLDRHTLAVRDIERIPRRINKSMLKKDAKRKAGYNLYIERNNYGNEFIQLSIELDFKKSNKATVRTIFIKKRLKNLELK